MISKALGGKAPARALYATLALFSLGAWGCEKEVHPPAMPTGGTGGSSPPPGVATPRDAGGGAGDRAPQSLGATGRFCNTIILRGGMSIDFTVEIGDPAVRMT